MRVGNLLAVALLIPGCDSGPSATDLQKIYQTPVQLVSCAKINDATYRCRFKFTNPRVAADHGEHTSCFATDGSTWNLKIFC